MLERWEGWMDRHERHALAALLFFYAAIVLAQGTLKLVWADELITWYIARQPGWSGIWRALAAGADPNPPLMHVMVQASTRVLGGNALGMRLPAMLCVLLAIVSMWLILRRWVRPVFALAGCLAFMATRGFDYAYDARSYAPMMGFAMASLALWMLAEDWQQLPGQYDTPTLCHSAAQRRNLLCGPAQEPNGISKITLPGWRRGAALAAMTLALAAGVSSNYYCVLAFFPIAIGEVAGRRFRPGVWVAMAIAALPLLAYLPLIRHNIAEFGPHAWNRPHWSMIPLSYLELVEGIFWPVLGLSLWAAWKGKRPRKSSSITASPMENTGSSKENAASSGAFTASLWESTLSPPESAALLRARLQPCHNGPATDPALAAGVRLPSASELAALSVLILYPILGFAIALAGAGMISPRCVAPVCCGIGLAAGLLAQRVFGASRRAGIAVVVVLILWVGVREGVCAVVLLQQRRAFFALRQETASQPGDEIVIGDSSFVLPLAFYSPASTRERIVFPIDFGAIHQFEQDDSGEQNLWAGRCQVFPFAIGALADVIPHGTSAVVVARPDGWLAHVLEREGARLTVSGDVRDWSRVGGVFTPMAHAETRILLPR